MLRISFAHPARDLATKPAWLCKAATATSIDQVL